MFQPDKDGIYATVNASPGRRLISCGMLVILGGLVIYVALQPPFRPVLSLFLLAFGAGAVYLADKQRRATALQIHLTQDELRDTAGHVLARMDDITGVDRGAFAFKPSNGFTLTLKTKQPRAWLPGLWWRLGRRVGVGGATSAGQTKFMAEQIALRLAQRDQA